MFSFAFRTQTLRSPFIGRGPRLGRRLIATAATLLIVVLASHAADASCGNYLYKNGKPVAGHPQSMPAVMLTESAATNPGLIPPWSSIPKVPCHGPNCSRSPFPGLPVPVPFSISRANETAVLSQLESALANGSHGVEVPQSESGAFYEPGSVFRPPAVI